MKRSYTMLRRMIISTCLIRTLLRYEILPGDESIFSVLRIQMEVGIPSYNSSGITKMSCDS